MQETRAARQRDPVLDLWRGLALVDMAWVHLALYPIGMPAALAVWIGEYTRFAAGAFVLISGMAVARVFGPTLLGRTPAARATRRRLLRRALMLVCVDRLAAVAFVIIERHRLTLPGASPRTPALGDLIFFAEPGVTGGLLVLYAMLLVGTPLLELVRRRFGGAAVLAASAAVYGIAWASDHGAHGATWPFPFAAWQPLYVFGYVLSHGFQRLGDRGVPAWWLALVSGGFAALFVVRNGVALGLVSPSLVPAWEFVKVPLNPTELAWYLLASGFVLTWSAWVWKWGVGTQRLLGWLARLGRKSLLVYVAHLFLELPIIELLTLADPGPLGRTAMLPLAAAVLVVVAAAGERLDRALGARAPTRVSVVFAGGRLPTSGIVGSGVAVAALLAVLALQATVGPPVRWQAERTGGADVVLDAAAIDVIPAEQEEAFDGLLPFTAADAVDEATVEILVPTVNGDVVDDEGPGPAVEAGDDAIEETLDSHPDPHWWGEVRARPHFGRHATFAL